MLYRLRAILLSVHADGLVRANEEFTAWLRRGALHAVRPHEEDDVEETVAALRRARAQAAVSRLRRAAAANGSSKLSAAEIEAEIAQTRRERRAGPAATAEG